MSEVSGCAPVSFCNLTHNRPAARSMHIEHQGFSCTVCAVSHASFSLNGTVLTLALCSLVGHCACPRAARVAPLRDGHTASRTLKLPAMVSTLQVAVCRYAPLSQGDEPVGAHIAEGVPPLCIMPDAPAAERRGLAPNHAAQCLSTQAIPPPASLQWLIQQLKGVGRLGVQVPAGRRRRTAQHASALLSLRRMQTSFSHFR